MPDATWKAAERAIAKALGGERTSAKGLGAAVPDIETEMFSVEVKTRRTLPQWLLGAMAQAKRNAGNKTAIVVLHKVGQRHSNDLVIVALSDFLALRGDDD